jgi:hypothetical protein
MIFIIIVIVIIVMIIIFARGSNATTMIGTLGMT